MKRHLFTLTLLLAAIALYAYGLVVGATLLLLVGVFTEVWFWLRVFGLDRSRDNS
jgi:hypothetical protein